MIADFYKSIKKPETERVLPAKVVKVLNKQLPRGYQYESDGHGHYVVKPSSKKTTQHFTGTVNYEKSGIPKEISQEQLGEYVYRTQKKIFFDDVKIVEDGKTLDFPDIYKDPITGEKTEIAHDFIMLPSPFPPAAPMKFETYDGEKVNIDFIRVPYDSFDYIKFENVSFPALKMTWTIPEREHKAELGPGIINLSATPSKAESVDDAILALKILKSFAIRRLKINDTRMGEDLGSATKLKNDQLEDRIKFWSLFKRLEGILNVRFDPGADYPEEDQHFAAELFYNFLDCKDFVYTKPFAHFHIGMNSLIKKEKAFDDIIGMPGLSLSFIGHNKATLMGAEFELYISNVLVDMTLEKIVFDEDKQGAELYISDAGEAPFKMIKRYYVSELEAKEGMNRIYTEYATVKRTETNEEPSELSIEEFDEVLSGEGQEKN